MTYELCVGRGKYVVKSTRGRITAKRVETYTRVWDHSGKRITKYRSGMMSLRLLAFQKDGAVAVVVAEATPATALSALVSG